MHSLQFRLLCLCIIYSSYFYMILLFLSENGRLSSSFHEYEFNETTEQLGQASLDTFTIRTKHLNPKNTDSTNLIIKHNH